MLAALLLLALQDAPAFAPGPFDRVVPLELTHSQPRLAGHGAAQRVEYTSEFSGTLHVWTQVEDDLDTFLRLEEPDGKLVAEDDNSAGGRAPYLKLDVEPGRKLIVIVAAARAEDSGKPELHLVAGIETDATRAASEAAQTALTEIKRLRAAKELTAARTLVVKTMEQVAATAGADRSPLACRSLGRLGLQGHELGILKATQRAWRLAYEHLAKMLPDGHPDLQAARANLAVAMYELGDLAGARVLQERLLEASTRTLPDDHADLRAERCNLAATLYAQHDFAGARVLFEKVVEVLTRTRHDEDRELQDARGNLAAALYSLRDFAGARTIFEKVLEVYARTLPEDDPLLQTARLNLANALRETGERARARDLGEQALHVLERVRTDDHPDLQFARTNLARTLETLGDFTAARVLYEKVLEVRSRMLPDDHPDLQTARSNMADVLRNLGDLAGARALEEKVLEVHSHKLPDDHPTLQAARSNLAATLYRLGELARARELQQKVVDSRSRTLPDEHADLQRARSNLACTLRTLGDLAGARALDERVLEVCTRTLPDDHADLQIARASLARTLARETLRSGAGTEKAPAAQRCAELMRALCRAEVRTARAAILGAPAREAEERCSVLDQWLDLALSFARGYGVFEPSSALEAESFALAETLRGAALGSAEFARRAANAPQYASLRSQLATASRELARVVQQGTSSGEFERARATRESLERELIALARDLSHEKTDGFGVDAARLAARLDAGTALVGFRRFHETHLGAGQGLDGTGKPALKQIVVDSLCAFVLRSSKRAADAASAPSAVLTLVDLGPIEPIEAAVRAWREALGVGIERGMAVRAPGPDPLVLRGAELRKRVFDPLLAALGDAQRLVVAVDDVLSLVPLEALPLADGAELVGDRFRIETRATLAEWMSEERPASGSALVALGGASFNLAPLVLAAADVNEIEPPQPAEAAAPHSGEPRSPLRGRAWERGFAPLTHTADEARGIGALYSEVFEDQRPVLVLEKRKASREALAELAPRARFVHIATHGWFAAESIRSWNDAEPLDAITGLAQRASGEEQVKGMSPMLLCGLALAGANLPADSVGRVPGLITADEISTLDLANCELVVLSACDTNVGERRAGQGVHSLQMALQMAGARSVITSLWKVPDEATKELMLDFYRRMWVEKKPKAQALWEAKKKLREALDESGKPQYSTRDWAAWVLTGDPN